MTRTKLALAIASISSIFAVQAQAYTITTDATFVAGQGSFTNVAGATTFDFNSGSLLPNYSGGGITSGTYVGSIQPTGDDSPYWNLGTDLGTTGQIVFGQKMQYFGMDWSTPDDYNILSLWNGSTLVGTFTGAAVGKVPSYINIFADNANEYFDRITFSSATNAFETDNHAWLAAAQVPEPGSYALMIAGLAMVGGFARYRSSKQ